MFEHLIRILQAAATAGALDADAAASLQATVEAMGTDESRAALTADQLTAADDALVALFADVRGGNVEGASADDVEGLREMGDVILAVRAEGDTRAEQAEARAAELAEIEARIAVTEAADPEAEAEVVAEAEAIVEAEPVAEPVAASLAELRGAQPAASLPTVQTRPGVVITTESGQVVESLAELAAVTAAAFTAARGGRTTQGGKDRLASVRFAHPESRRLYNERADRDKLEAVLADAGNAANWSEAVIASGGFCAAPDVDYAVPTVGVEDRPVRDGLPAFGLQRGAVQVSVPPTLASIDVANGVDATAAVTVWTNTNDVTPGADIKGSQTIDCSSMETFTAAAIVRRLRWGNFGAMAQPENVEAWQRYVLIAHARLAESRSLDQIKAASVAKTTPTMFGAARDLAEAIARAAAQIRSANRMPADYRFRVMAPEWVTTLGSVDLLRGLQSDPAFVTDAERIFRDALANAGVNVTLYKDTPSTGTSQVLSVGGAGALSAWPSTVQWGIFPEGRFAFGSMETLDLGIYRSPELNDTNDVENFAETFEVIIDHNQGDALWVTSTVCPDGSSGAGVDVAVCAS